MSHSFLWMRSACAASHQGGENGHRTSIRECCAPAIEGGPSGDRLHRGECPCRCRAKGCLAGRCLAELPGDPGRGAAVGRCRAGPAGGGWHAAAGRPGRHRPGLSIERLVRDLDHDRRRCQPLHQQRAAHAVLHQQSAGRRGDHQRALALCARLHVQRHPGRGRLHRPLERHSRADAAAGARRAGAALHARFAHPRQRAGRHLPRLRQCGAHQHQLRRQPAGHQHAGPVGQWRRLAGEPDRRHVQSELPECRSPCGRQFLQPADDPGLRARLPAERRRGQYLRRRRRPRCRRLPGPVHRHGQHLQRARHPECRLARRPAGGAEAARRRILRRLRLHAHAVGARLPRRHAPADARHACVPRPSPPRPRPTPKRR